MERINCCAKALIWKIILTGIRVCHKVKMYLKCYKKSTREGKIMYGTIWALLPPVVAIVLALITKEVYSSLFIGIVTGALIYTGFSPIATLDTVINEGFINSVADAWNIGIFMFLILLGTMVALMNKAGGSAAFGEWAKKHVKTRAGALLSTFLLGVLIFVDDYFNCLTVGSVMMPVTDGHKISRAKLAYIIDATAAPICMIAPISSWAAAVSGMVDEGVYSGIELFVRAIPYNYYSLLTIVFVIGMALMGFDYGPMVKHERNAREKGDLFTEGERVVNADNAPKGSTRGKVYDLLIPVIVLIVCCVIGMIYVGGFFEGVGFIDAFSATDASVGLPWGSLIALLFFWICKRRIKVKVNKKIVAAAMCLVFTNLLYVIANKLTTAANAIVLQYTAPIFVLIWDCIYQRKKPEKYQCLVVVMAFSGMILFFFDQLDGGRMMGNLLAICAGICFSGVYFLNSLPESSGEDASMIAFCLSFIIALPFMKGVFLLNRTALLALKIFTIFSKKEALIQALLLTILGLRSKVSGPQSGPFFKNLHEFI